MRMLRSTTLNTAASSKVSAQFAKQQHPFHILDASPFPFLTGLFAFIWLVPQVFYMHGLPIGFLPRSDLMHAGFVGLFLTIMSWFLAILKESSQGYHTKKVQLGLRGGMLLFILSEVMFFFAFFWSFFHYTLIPSVSIGAIWPPVGTQELDVWGLPLVNTMLLLTSGVTITIAHAYLINDRAPVGKMVDPTDFNRRGFQWYLFLTVLLGATFLICQAYEYKHGVKFSWRENIYGSIFFVTTGFHGLHVTIGTLFLAFCLMRDYMTRWAFIPELKYSASALLGKILFGKSTYLCDQGTFGLEHNHHFGFEAAAWYWHFVDVVWLFLFLTIYWWGGR